MARPITRNHPRKHEFDTPKRARFFHAFDTREKGQSLRSICRQEDINISHQVGSLWLKKRDQLGSPAVRRTRKLSSRQLGRPYSVSEQKLRQLLHKDHPSHSLHYSKMVKAEHLPITPFTQNFKEIRIKAISKKNKVLRVAYSKRYEKKTIRAFW